MKNYTRFFEPQKLREFSEKLMDRLYSADSKEEALIEFADELEDEIKQRLIESGIADSSFLSRSLSDCIKAEMKWFESGAWRDDENAHNRTHFVGSAAKGAHLIYLIRKGEYELAIVEALSFAADSAERLKTGGAGDLNCFDFDPLFGDYLEPEDMTPSSDGGICDSIISRAREVWGVGPLTERDSYSDKKHRSALFIRNSHMHVFQYAGRHTEWKEPGHRTDWVTHEHLDYQIQPKWVMYHLRGALGARERLDKNTSEAEVYAIYAILHSFQVLEEIANAECLDERHDLEAIDRYLKEAQGFLSKALEFKHQQDVQAAGEKAIAKHQGDKGKKKSPWGKNIAVEIQERLLKAGPQKSKLGFAKNIKEDIISLRKQVDNGNTWSDDHSAIQYINKKVGEIHRSIFPEK